jgi:hypothetical protein
LRRIHLFPVLRSLLLCIFTIYYFYLSTTPSMLGQVLPFAFLKVPRTDGVSVSVTVCHLFLTIFSFPLCREASFSLWFKCSNLLEKAKYWCGFAVKTKIEDLISCLTLELLFTIFHHLLVFSVQRRFCGKRQKLGAGLSFCKLTSRPN